MKNNHQLTQTALFITLIFVVTSLTSIPILPYGYFNLGDSILLALAYTLPIGSSIWLGIGPTMSDVLSPFMFYAPYTFIIKTVGILTLKFIPRKLPLWLRLYITSILMSILYGGVDIILTGSVNAFIPSIIANGLQTLFSPILALILIPLTQRAMKKVIR